MPRLAAALLAGALLALPARRAIAEDVGPLAVAQEVPVPVNLSTELLDTTGYSRFHLVTRGSFSNGSTAFSDASTWAFEARGNVRILDGLTLAVTLPFGLAVPSEGQRQFFFGNFSLGVSGGGTLHLSRGATEGPGVRLRLGAAADVYAPTAPKPDAQDLADATRTPPVYGLFLGERAVASMRSYEPWLYLPDLMAFRARLQAGVSVGVLTASFELGVAPAFTLESSSELLVWLSAAGRVSALVHPAIEPFVEGGSATQLVSPGAGDPTAPRDFTPPFLVTPGVRFHFGAFDPAIFASISLKNSADVVFGIDLAGAFVTGRRSDTERIDEFFGNFD